MKKNCKLSIVLVLIINVCCGFVKAENNFSEGKLANSLVWEITGPGINKPSYIAGTMHIICEKDFNIDERFITAIKKTDQMYLENDIDAPDEMMLLQKSMFVEESLKTRLKDIEYQKFSKFLNNHPKLNIEMFDKMHPGAIQSTILVTSLKCNNIKSMEMELMLLAKQSSQKVFGLDTAEESSEIFNQVFKSIATDADFYTYNNMQDSFDETLEHYQNEKITELYKTIVEHMHVYPNKNEMIKALLDNRNNKWVKNIPNIVRNNPTFFAFGTAHLAGENGVINLLRQAGLTVKPVFK